MMEFNAGVICSGTCNQGFRTTRNTTITQKIENIEIGNQILCRGTVAKTLAIPAKIRPPEVGIPPNRTMA
jgi:hypothetical protein